MLSQVHSECSSVTPYLGFDLFGGVCEEDRGIGIAGAHLGLRALQGREERGVQQRWFGVADPGSHVSGHPEVRILWERERRG